jgi:hypothetical protein
MRIRVVRSGGFAGIQREHVVDTGELSPAQRARVEGVIDRVGFFTLPEGRAAGLPDVPQYHVTVEESDRSREITFDEQSAPGELLELLRALLNQTDGA